MSAFEAAIAELEGRGIMPETAPDLERMRHALNVVGYFEWPFFKKNQGRARRTIIVAGTNGKGTTCAALATLLTDAGERVGFYSSPHLESYTERLRIGLTPITEDLFARAHQKVNVATHGLPLTHFEILTLMAAWVFCSGEAGPVCDRLILEVGLGGTWDATNAFPHDFAVITRLGLDHENLLGTGLLSVAKNKLGIVPQDGTVVHIAIPNEAAEALNETKMTKKGRWVTPENYRFEVNRERRPRFVLKTRWGPCALPLPGARAAENINLALTVFNELGFKPEGHLAALEKMTWPGRMEFKGLSAKKTPVYLSGDHNPQGIASLIELLDSFERDQLLLVVGIGKDKDRNAMLGLLNAIPRCQIYLTTTPFRGAAVTDYGELGPRMSAFSEPHAALAAAVDAAGENDLIVVTGSLYLVGYLRAAAI